jgi:hypothetical protein
MRVKLWEYRVAVTLIVIVLITAVLTVAFFVECCKAEPDKERPFGTPSYVLFGLSTVASLCVSIYILKTLIPRTFTDSKQLLQRFIRVFQDAIYSQQRVDISLLHFVPCPGLFDEEFKNDPSFSVFSSLLDEAKQEKRITIRVAMLHEEGRDEFLKRFYEHESQYVSSNVLKGKRGFDSYYAKTIVFLQGAFVQPGKWVIKSHNIDKTWLETALRGEQFIILGAARKVGFIGSVSFIGGAFKFKAADYEGNVEVIHELFNRLVEIYEKPPLK